jgi:hypothetical protein
MDLRYYRHLSSTRDGIWRTCTADQARGQNTYEKRSHTNPCAENVGSLFLPKTFNYSQIGVHIWWKRVFRVNNVLVCPSADPGMKVSKMGGRRLRSHLVRAAPPRREGPRCRRAAEHRDELAAPHAITSSVPSSNDVGISRLNRYKGCSHLPGPLSSQSTSRTL